MSRPKAKHHDEQAEKKRQGTRQYFNPWHMRPVSTNWVEVQRKKRFWKQLFTGRLRVKSQIQAVAMVVMGGTMALTALAPVLTLLNLMNWWGTMAGLVLCVTPIAALGWVLLINGVLSMHELSKLRR